MSGLTLLSPEYGYVHPVVPMELGPFRAGFFFTEVTVKLVELLVVVDNLEPHLAFPGVLWHHLVDLPIFDVDP